MSASRPQGLLATSGWQIHFATREKTKARGSPTGRRPYSALVFYGQDLGFKVKPKSFFILWFQPGGGYAAHYPIETKDEVSPLGANHVKKPPWANSTVVAPEIKQVKTGGAHAGFF